MTKLWKVGDLAKLTGLTVRTLRFYDQIGLFSPSAQTESGHRLYGESDLSRLHQILALKELGLSLEEVRSVLNGGQVSPLAILELQMERLREQIRHHENRLDLLRHVSKSVQREERLSAEDFAKLLQAMKTEFEKPVFERRSSWERHLDRLGETLVEENENQEP